MSPPLHRLWDEEKLLLTATLFVASTSLPLTEHTLDDLLLLKKEGAEDALTDALGAARATVRTGDVLLALAQTVQRGGAHARNASELAAAVAAAHGLRGLADVMERQLAARHTHGAALVAAGLVRAAATVSKALNHFSKQQQKQIGRAHV